MLFHISGVFTFWVYYGLYTIYKSIGHSHHIISIFLQGLFEIFFKTMWRGTVYHTVGLTLCHTMGQKALWVYKKNGEPLLPCFN